MTATPIPRTLMLTAHGDMDVSRLTERPPGRQPTETRTLSLDRLDEVVDGVARALARDAQLYSLCPLVEESANVDIPAAASRCRPLHHRSGDTVGPEHGSMWGPQKAAVLATLAPGAPALRV